MENLKIILTCFDKNMTADAFEIDDKISFLNENYNVKCTLLVGDNVLSTDSLSKIQDLQKTQIDLKIYSYKAIINGAIQDELNKTTSNKVLVCDLKYLQNSEVIKQMFSIMEDKSINIVHIKKTQNGFFSEIINIVNNFNNKFIKMFSDSENHNYIFNCVLFNELTLNMIKRFPKCGAIIKENDGLCNSHTAIIEVGKDFLGAKKRFDFNIIGLISIILFILGIGAFVVSLTVRMDLDLLLWCIVGAIAFVMGGIVLFNYGRLNSKIKIMKFGQNDYEKPIFERVNY